MPTLFKCLIFLIFLYIFFSSIPKVSAQQPAFLSQAEFTKLGFSGYERINPNLLIYPLKRFTEELKLNLLDDGKKKRYYHKLFDVRFKELVYIVNNRKEGFIFFTADRYNSFVGTIKSQYPPDAAEKIKISDYLKILEILRDRFPSNSPYWEKLQQTIDTTKSLI